MATETQSKKIKVIIVPGNGCTNIMRSNWYGWLAMELRTACPHVDVICKNFPDPYVARKSVWLPFMKDQLGADENTILVGHSSGAEAIMRFLENNAVLGAAIVSACWSDLGDSNERASGYYADEWQWDKIASNAKWLVQYGSTDDPFIPKEEMRYVAQNVNSEYIEYDDRGHFMDMQFPELLELLVSRLEQHVL